MKTDSEKLVKLAKSIVRVLEKRCLAGCLPQYKNWDGFQNGNGEDVGGEIEALILRAKKIIEKHEQS